MIDKLSNKGINHANVIFIYLFKKTLERFEPYGVLFMTSEKKINNAIKTRLLSILELEDFKYLSPLDISPKFGLQSKADAYGGMCVTFSMLYLQLRLMNPDVIQKELVNYLLNKERKDLINIILRYAKFIEITLKKYDYQIFEDEKYIQKKWFDKQEYIISKKNDKIIKIL
jgi:hypothetical protein